MAQKLKIVSTCKLKNNLYSIEFNDGILLGIKYSGKTDTWDDVGPMCSLGTNSYFYEKGHWPKGNNLRKRLLMGTDMIKARMNRYRRTNVEEE